MNNTQLQIKFRQRLNKLASNDYDNIECWQMVEAFNKAQVEWVRRQLRGMNTWKDGDEMSKRRVDDLQLLLTNQTLAGTNIPNHSCYGYDLPTDPEYMEFKRVQTYATHECCEGPQQMTTYLAEQGNVDIIMRDTLKRPDFEWGETFCTMSSNQLRVYYRDFDISSTQLWFYRQPRKIQIAGCTDPVDGGFSPVDVECEFKDDVVELMIDEAVSVIAGDINDVNQYMRGSQTAEKNN